MRAHGRKAMMSLREFLLRLLPTTWKWIGIGLGAFVAMHIYYVQEMIAALAIFSVLFLAGSIVALVIFLLDRAGRQITEWAELDVARLARWVVDAAETIVGSPLWAQAVPHRFRKAQLKETGKS